MTLMDYLILGVFLLVFFTSDNPISGDEWTDEDLWIANPMNKEGPNYKE